MSYTAEQPIQYTPDPSKFGALAGGKVWFGVPNGNPASVPGDRIQVYLARQGLADLAIAQPIDIGPGGVWYYSGSPAQIKVLVPYCVQILNSLGVQKFYAPAAGDEIAKFNQIDADLLNSLKTVTTYSDLSSTSASIGQQVSLKGYFAQGDGGGDIFDVVSSASKTANNGTIAINGAFAFVRKKIFITLKQFGCKGDGVTDDTTRINEALSIAGSIGEDVTVFINVGTFLHSTLIAVPQNVTFFGAGDLSVLKCKNAIPNNPSAGSPHQGQSVWAKTGSRLRNFKIDGGGFNSGGVVAVSSQNIKIEAVNTVNGGPIGAQAIQLFDVDDATVRECNIDQSLMGFQIWACSNIKVIGNSVNKVFGGIFFAGSSDSVVVGNQVSNCEDVGLDFEGGSSCTFVGNVVRACKNAELSMFKDDSGTGIGCFDLTWNGNTVHRTATYIKRDGTTDAVNTGADSGAIWIASMSNNSKGIVFCNNTVRVDANAGRLWYVTEMGTGEQELTFSNNVFSTDCDTTPLFRAVVAYGFKYIDNIHHLNRAMSLTSEIKNAKNGVISGNKFYCKAAPTNYLIRLYTDIASQQTCKVFCNEFYNSDQYAITVDQFNSGFNSYEFSGNILSDTPSVNGGLNIATANGQLKFVNQKLLIAIPDSTNPTVAVDFSSAIPATVGTTYAPVVEGTLCLNLGGIQKNLYKFLYQTGAIYSMTGSGVSTGVGASATDYATFTGSTVTITKTAPAVNKSFFELTLNTAQ